MLLAFLLEEYWIIEFCLGVHSPLLSHLFWVLPVKEMVVYSNVLWCKCVYHLDWVWSGKGLSLLNRFLSTDCCQFAKLCCLYKVQNLLASLQNCSMGNLREDGEFCSCSTSSLTLGDGGLLFHFILSKIVANCELLLGKANP